MDESRTKIVALTSVMTALVYVMTSISVRMPAPMGVWHIGDVASFISGILFGPMVGAFACGIGATLFDVWNPLGGSAYITWAPATIVIRGIMGYLLGRYRKISKSSVLISDITIMAIAHVWKNLAYFAYDYYLFGPAAWLDIYTFFPLSAVSIAVTIPLLQGLRRVLNVEYVM